MAQPTAKIFVLNRGTSREVNGAVDYSAYFGEPLAPTGATAIQISAFAAKLGVGVTLAHEGAPFIGMKCRVDFDPLNPADVAQFEAEFHPQHSSAIPYL